MKKELIPFLILISFDYLFNKEKTRLPKIVSDINSSGCKYVKTLSKENGKDTFNMAILNRSIMFSPGGIINYLKENL